MNREILFRGKRVDNGEWVYGSLIHRPVNVAENPSEYAAIVIFDKHADSSYNAYLELEVDPSTIGQYTGLTDRKGNNVFEGDIFTANEYPFTDDGEPNYYGVVEWIFAGFQYVLKLSNPEKIGISEGINEPLEDGGWLTVIGTIHDTHLTKQS